jgi:uncharacterized protein with HEPN domain
VASWQRAAAHGYAGLNLDLVWEIAAEHLAPLLRVVGQELEAQDV